MAIGLVKSCNVGFRAQISSQNRGAVSGHHTGDLLIRYISSYSITYAVRERSTAVSRIMLVDHVSSTPTAL